MMTGTDIFNAFIVVGIIFIIGGGYIYFTVKSRHDDSE
jgi:LPXTG-motif cell wall-anchored protein